VVDCLIYEGTSLGHLEGMLRKNVTARLLDWSTRWVTTYFICMSLTLVITHTTPFPLSPFFLPLLYRLALH
jgi:hypothetical protein